MCSELLFSRGFELRKFLCFSSHHMIIFLFSRDFTLR